MQHMGPLVPGTWGGGQQSPLRGPVLQHELFCARFSKRDGPTPYGYVSLRHCCRTPLALSSPPPVLGTPVPAPQHSACVPCLLGGGSCGLLWCHLGVPGWATLPPCMGYGVAGGPVSGVGGRKRREWATVRGGRGSEERSPAPLPAWEPERPEIFGRGGSGISFGG